MGLLATKDMTWDVAMDKISEDNKTYIAALLRRGEDLNRAPRIKVSTIHGTKGGEATMLFCTQTYQMHLTNLYLQTHAKVAEC